VFQCCRRMIYDQLLIRKNTIKYNHLESSVVTILYAVSSYISANGQIYGMRNPDLLGQSYFHGCASWDHADSEDVDEELWSHFNNSHFTQCLLWIVSSIRLAKMWTMKKTAASKTRWNTVTHLCQTLKCGLPHDWLVKAAPCGCIK